MTRVDPGLETSPAPPSDRHHRQDLTSTRAVLVEPAAVPERAVTQLRRSSPARRISAGSPRTHRDLLPDPRPATERLAQAIAEVLAGARPAGQLAGVATLDVLRLLARSAGRLGGRPGSPPQRPIVGSVRVTEPCAGVVEACAVINTGDRMRALALRLEGIDGRWRCTAIHLG